MIESVRVITCLVKPVFFIRHGWRKWTEICHKILFQSRSICDRITSIGAKGGWKRVLNRSKVCMYEYSRFRDGRKLVESEERGGRPKSTRNEVTFSAVAANLLKNDRRIAPKLITESFYISSDLERGFRKENVVCAFCFGTSRPILITGQQISNFFLYLRWICC
jgi:hypothetical protein